MSLTIDRLKNIILNLLIVFSIIFIVKYIYKFWPLIVNLRININFSYLLIITFLLISQHFLYVFIWRKLLAHLEVKFSYPELLRIHFLTILTKYIPGQVWLPLSRGKFITDRGVSVRKTTFIILLDFSLSFIAAVLVIISCFLIYKYGNKYSGVCVYYPIVLLGSANIIYNKKAKFSTNENNIKSRWLLFAKAVFDFYPYYLFLAILDGIIFYSFLNLFVSLGVNKIPIYVGLNSVLRIIFCVLPSQLGIGETIQLFFLKYFLTAPYFVLMPLLLRSWKVVIDSLLFITICFLFPKIKLLFLNATNKVPY